MLAGEVRTSGDRLTIPGALADEEEITMKSGICIIIIVLLAGIIAIPGVNAENQTMDTIYLLTHGETLAGQKDMSRYSNIQKPETHPHDERDYCPSLSERDLVREQRLHSKQAVFLPVHPV